MGRVTFPALRAFCERQLFDDILPFWMKRGVDRAVGGFCTRFSNRGDRLLHPHKFTWSQRRFVWMLSWLAREFKSQRPVAEVVALSVKDPFHITREFIRCLGVPKNTHYGIPPPKAG